MALVLSVLLGFLVLVAFRRRGAAIYESYEAFAAAAKRHERRDVGRTFLFRGPLRLIATTRRASIRDAYHQLQSARRRTAITEPEYRAAIDELLARAVQR